MKYLRETTDWKDCEYRVPNHTYIVEGGRGGRMLGYIKAGTSEKIMFNGPRQFNRKNRTFEEVKV